MTVKDYTKNVETADTLVAKFGRAVTLRKLLTTGETNKPWRSDADADAVSEPDTDTATKAVFIGPSKALSEEFLAGVEDVAIVAGPTDYSAYRILFDGTTVFKIIRQQKVQPGGTIVLTYLGLAR